MSMLIEWEIFFPCGEIVITNVAELSCIFRWLENKFCLLVVIYYNVLTLKPRYLTNGFLEDA